MKAKEIFDALKATHLHGLAVADWSKDETLKKAQFVMWLNMAIDKIYTDLAIQQEAFSVKRGIDTPHVQLPENYVNITYAELFYRNRVVPVNREDREDSILYEGNRTFYIPNIYIGESLVLYYISVPEKRIVDENSDVPLEKQYMMALMQFIAYLAKETINGAPNWEHQSHLSRYEKEIMHLRANGLAPSNGIYNYKFAMRGFV